MDNSKLQSRGLSKLLEDNVVSYVMPRPVLRTTFVDDRLDSSPQSEDNNTIDLDPISIPREMDLLSMHHLYKTKIGLFEGKIE